ncbi:Scarecrow-like protein 5 [Capsicum baccatum]|uniref:Scarecrow-like protein 5 n=1 Tax=Capsicum baccatum TaxID=33114 RepID=A0A2G2UW87_CAPBA|nr:Scarecrow-like protein 5 [Capsicum baccatum]
MMEMMPRGDLKEVPIAYVKVIAENTLITAKWLMSELCIVVFICGSPMQRLGAYMLEGLVARLTSSGRSIYNSLRCKEPTSVELFSYMPLLYEICPYFKFGYLSANGAITDAMKNENSIHIIDFQVAQCSQWITLIHALAARPGGPHESASRRLMISHQLTPEEGGLKLDGLLRMVKSLSPKIVTLVKQESNTNTVQFFPSFLETLNYYLSVFESIDVALPRNHKERINVEQHCLAREIVDILACEGAERVEHHKLLERWSHDFLWPVLNPIC